MLALVISNRLWEIIKWPFLIVGFAFVAALLGGIALASFALVRSLWRRLSRREFGAFAVWMIVNFALTLGATLAIVHQRSRCLPGSD